MTKAKDLLVKQEVIEKIMECEAAKCRSLRRRNRDRSGRHYSGDLLNEEFFIIDDEDDFKAKMKNISIQRIMDSVHCYLVHSIRIPPSQIEEKRKELMTLKDGGGDNEDDECRDYWTEAICTLMVDRRKLSRFRDSNRFKSGYNKFMTYDAAVEHELSINATNNANEDEKSPSVSSIKTFSEELKTELQNAENGIENEIVSSFDVFVEREDFDSETVHDDLEDFRDSNILKELSCSQNDANGAINSFRSRATKFISRKVGSSDTYFSSYRFFYWPFYRDNTDEGRAVFACGGMHQHTERNPGYTLGDWYIKSKYEKFKEEALQNKSVKITGPQWARTLTKAKILLRSWMRSGDEKVCGWYAHGNDMWAEAYGLEDGARVTVAHIVALLLYCDYTITCKEFSETFRKIWPFESDDSLKRRHAEVAIWSRLLRELIECFGFPMRQPDEEMKYCHVFYHGISGSKVFKRTSNFLCGPVSTSPGT